MVRCWSFVHAFGSAFDLEIARKGIKSLEIRVKEVNQLAVIYKINARATGAISHR
jgi:hypothetical protein